MVIHSKSGLHSQTNFVPNMKSLNLEVTTLMTVLLNLTTTFGPNL